jgi:hypothetical protein
MAVLLHRLGVLRLLAIQLGALEQHLVDAAGLRAVRILDRLAFRMVLAVDRCPLPGDHPGRQPQPAAEEVRDQRMQVECTVGHRAVQVDRHRRDRHVGGDQRERDDLPGARIEQPGVEEAQHGLDHGKFHQVLSSLCETAEL